MMLLNGCAETVSSPPVGLCQEYPAEVSNQVADEVAAYLPPGSATTRIIADYMAARAANCP